ncbi:hypothetical protein KIN20_026721 [Parelaphostrongylus tenuis]|uniref:Uncharacterized protein n=1 Tax=Parelaphostrongylus tenuis TaxID=148309 RepID=A0AAD5QYE1_PARTN|nr:hypothetical protein KIN20_026721 [Parelaphostrongylus tenuis]
MSLKMSEIYLKKLNLESCLCTSNNNVFFQIHVERHASTIVTHSDSKSPAALGFLAMVKSNHHYGLNSREEESNGKCAEVSTLREDRPSMLVSK